MKDIINLAGGKDKVGYVMPDKAEMGVPREVGQIFLVAGDEIVHPNDIMTFSDQTVRQMGTEEAGCTSYQNAHLFTPECRMIELNSITCQFYQTAR